MNWILNGFAFFFKNFWEILSGFNEWIGSSADEIETLDALLSGRTTE